MSSIGESTPSVLTQPMSEHRRCFLQIVLVVRSELRGYFGEHFADHWGFFTDRHMCSEIHRLADWIDYPKGDRLLMKHRLAIYSLTVSNDGHFGFVGLQNGKVVMFDLLTNNVIREWKAHSEAVWCLAHHHSGLLCSGSGDGSISLWNSFDECKLIRSYVDPSQIAGTVDFMHSANEIVTGSSDWTIRLWSVKTGECTRKLRGHQDWITTVLFIGDLIISGSLDKEIRIWKGDESECIRVIKDDAIGRINQVCINSDHSMIAALFDTGLTLFKWPGMEIIRTIEGSAHYGQFHPIHPHLLAVGDRSDYSVRIYNVMSEECVGIFKGHSNTVRRISFTPDGCRLLSVSSDQTTRIWESMDVSIK